MNTFKQTNKSGMYSLADMADIFPGATPNRRDEPSNDGIPFIQVGDLREDTASIAPLDSLSRIHLGQGQSFDRYMVRDDDVLMSSKGTLGRLAVVPESYKGAVASSNLLILRPKPGISPHALLGILKSSPVQRYIQSRSRGVSIQTISARDLEELQVPFLDSRASDVLRNLLESHAALIDSLKRAEESRNRLMGLMLDQIIWSELK